MYYHYSVSLCRNGYYDVTAIDPSGVESVFNAYETFEQAWEMAKALGYGTEPTWEEPLWKKYENS